jgi:hypothetical protein
MALGIALAVLTLISGFALPAAAETTHEANVAAREIAAASAVPSTLSIDEALAQITDADDTIRFDITEDGTRFVRADNPAFNDGLPARSATYIAQGYIYPAGTLTADVDGVNADGSPEFPDKVLGQWSSYGWYIGDGTQSTEGPWMLSTQLYQFGSEWGEATLVSEGYILSNTGSTVERAIIGGTGPFANVRGQLADTNLGLNETEGRNARYEVHLMGTATLLS